MEYNERQVPRLVRGSLSLLAGLLLLAGLWPGGMAGAGSAVLAAPLNREQAPGAPTPQMSPMLAAPNVPHPPGTGFIPPPIDFSHLSSQWEKLEAAPQVLPANYDWRNVGGTNYVTPVKNQGACGSCYAFGTVGSFESKLLIDGAGLYDLSENNAKECNWREVNNFQYPDPGDYWGSCNGGNAFMLASLFSQKGTVLESCDPYNADDVGCKSSCTYQQTVLDWRVVSGSTVPPEGVLKQYLYDHGPLMTSMYVDPDFGFNSSYNGSYTLNYTSPAGSTNHLVLIVGWSNNLPPVQGSIFPASGWIVKNSWGTGWGNNGYFYITYGSGNIGLWSSFFDDWQSYDPNGDLWYYDDDGWWNGWGYGSPTAWGLAKFIPDHNTNVTRVEFWTTDATTDVDVYLYDNFNGSAPSGLLASKLNNSFSEPGYHSVALDTPVPVTSGNDIVAVVKFTNTSSPWPVAADPNGPIETGRTYISSNGSSWADMGVARNTDLAIRVRTSTAASVPPTVTSITPSAGLNTGTVHITNLAGTNFQPGATVKLTKASQPDINATNVVRVSPTQITCDLDLSGKATGAWNVVVTNLDAKSGTLTNGFAVAPPIPEPHYVYLPMVAR